MKVPQPATGNDCRLVDLSVGEFLGLVARGERLVKELEKDSIRLHGYLVAAYTQREGNPGARDGLQP